ncbi:uncharacterized protein [Apostichopus japonicus]|uniref:uncharacterized protein n=1 Tax=Stichopus japonicus TaxID=307972 RepID=UPI003AB8C6FE
MQVELLIGQDVPEALVPIEVRKGKTGDPYAIRTQLGWAVSGPLGKPGGNPVCHFVCSNAELDTQLKKFWKIDSSENLAHENGLSPNDKRAVAMWEETICHTEGHYQLGIPFKQQPVELPNNRECAAQRLKGLAKRLRKDSNLQEKYAKAMGEVLNKGYAQVVPEEEIGRSDGAVWYLPHHPVTHPMKPDKVRIVYDCASVYKGTSINENVHQGPDMANKLFGVLLRFREGRVALMADIESMFYQVRVSPSNRDVMRFLWWPGGNMNVEPQEYRMCVHVFGGCWSPSCCNFALQRTAEDNQGNFKESTINTVRSNFYVDDCLKAVSTEEEAIELYSELKELLSKGGFKLTKWITNSVKVLSHIPQDDRAKAVKDIDFNQEALPVERALGVFWDVNEDSFGYKVNLRTKPLTRRGLLSVVSSVYDPLGFACPFTIKGKAIIQDLCRRQLGWDEPLPRELIGEWLAWKADISKLDMFRVSRCLAPGVQAVSRHELHHFSDASEKAYGAVSYLRTIYEDGAVHCGIVMAKAHLAPLRQVTIPRLELTAATLSVKLDTMIRRELGARIDESFFWTDSAIVLSYISNQEKRFKTFVANRVALIHEGSAPSQWRHVPTHQNPADDASRGLTAGELVDKGAWVLGPDFLWEDDTRWPKGLAASAGLEGDPEVKVVKVESYVIKQEAVNEVLHKYFEGHSSWLKLQRNVAWILRFRRYLLFKMNRRNRVELKGPLTITELQEAEEAIVRCVQREHFREFTSEASEVKLKGSVLRKLDPYLSQTGVLCVGGRLSNAPVKEGMMHPPILPKDSHVTELVVRYTHGENGHVGREHVLSLLRERFWIIGARSIVRRVVTQCFTCRRATAPKINQKMADLPFDRVKPDMPPFSFVGIDYFGPFMVKRGRSEVKRYGCMFTCLVVRAIHIEIAHSLDTDSFIHAFQRFVARMGVPIEIRSDNGSNFVGAERELRSVIEAWNETRITCFLQQKMIKWRFNTPYASNMGGVWERLIRTTRKVLRSLTREQVLDDEKLLTLMCKVESIVNSRPLTYVSDDVSDPEPLTPNHLLLLRQGSAIPADTFDKKDMYCRRRWRQVQYLAGVFWRRWCREYLALMQERQKWLEPQRNLAVGDIVLLVDEELPRNKWVIGRVVEIYPGKDNLVRSVKVKTSSANLVRPVRKLCLLETIEGVSTRSVQA